jgi:hypothetical protein
VAWRIDTTPLDLARAAYHIGSTAMSRCFGYGLARVNTSRARCLALQTMTSTAPRPRSGCGLRWPGGTELLFIPPIMLHDPLTEDPVGWLKRVMKQYVGTEEAE